MCSPGAPDMTAQNTAAASQAAMSAEQLAWTKQIYADSAPERAAATARANVVSDASLESMRKQSALADDYANYQATTFRPLEKGIVADASAYDTPERRAAESADVMAKVGTQFDIQRGTARREAAAAGVDPSSGNFASRTGMLDITQAAQQAGAGNAAVKQVETIGAAKKMDAASLGRNLASNQATSAGIALNAGNVASGHAQVPGAVTAQGAALMNTGFNGAQGGLANAANTYGSISRAQAGAGDNSGMWQAGGAVAGAAVAAVI